MWRETERRGNAFCCCQDAVYGCVIFTVFVADGFRRVKTLEGEFFLHVQTESNGPMLPSQVLNPHLLLFTLSGSLKLFFIYPTFAP